MLIVTAPEDVVCSENDIKIFLAGGISNCRDWQNEVISGIKDLGYENSLENLVIFNPRRADFNISKENLSYEVRKQIEWEFNRLEECDIFSMYFVNSTSVQPICMYELGRNILKIQYKFPNDWADRIIITVEEGYSRLDDVLIQTELATGLTNLVQISDVKRHTGRIIKNCMLMQNRED